MIISHDLVQRSGSFSRLLSSLVLRIEILKSKVGLDIPISHGFHSNPYECYITLRHMMPLGNRFEEPYIIGNGDRL